MKTNLLRKARAKERAAIARRAREGRPLSGDPCDVWPRCACVLQGFINPLVRTGCGPKPKGPGRHAHVRSTVEELLDP